MRISPDFRTYMMGFALVAALHSFILSLYSSFGFNADQDPLSKMIRILADPVRKYKNFNSTIPCVVIRSL
jgi:hypothetical protein